MDKQLDIIVENNQEEFDIDAMLDALTSDDVMMSFCSIDKTC